MELPVFCQLFLKTIFNQNLKKFWIRLSKTTVKIYIYIFYKRSIEAMFEGRKCNN